MPDAGGSTPADLPSTGARLELRVISGAGPVSIPAFVQAVVANGLLLVTEWDALEEHTTREATLAWPTLDGPRYLHGDVSADPEGGLRFTSQGAPDRRASVRAQVDGVTGSWRRFAPGAMREPKVAEVEDLSFEGMCLVVDEPVDQHAQLIVTIDAPGSDPVTVLAEVVRDGGERDGGRYALGLRFGRLEISQRELVHRLLKPEQVLTPA
jgi:hypothetical protein